MGLKTPRWKIVAGILYAGAYLDYSDYAENLARTRADKKKHKALAQKMRKKAEKISGKKLKWLQNEGFMSLTENQQETMTHLHPTELEGVAGEIVRLKKNVRWW